VAAGGATLSPWAPGVTFGVGQFAGAAALYLSLERPASREDASRSDETTDEV
jgi:hypothetical protein